MKCAHCQMVHNYKFECQEIKDLKTFCDDDKYQEKLQKKSERKRRIRN